MNLKNSFAFTVSKWKNENFYNAFKNKLRDTYAVIWLFFLSLECVPLVNVNFTGDEIINLSQQSYIQVDGVSQVESGLAYVTYGFFNGMSSSIQIPRLNAVALPRLRIQIRFFASTPANARYQVLVSNCRSKAKSWDIPEVAENQSPSLAIIADTADNHLTFLGYSDDWKVRPVLFRLPYKVNLPHTFKETENVMFNKLFLFYHLSMPKLQMGDKRK